MISIVKADKKDLGLLAELGKKTLIESHSASAPAEAINSYVNTAFNEGLLRKELGDEKIVYNFIYHDAQPAGYSKIVLDARHPKIELKNVTKLDRLYLLKEFYDLKLGAELLNFNLELSRQAGQAGMWLFVWQENHRAINFYKRMGFEIICEGYFRLTEDHSNPNYQMLLAYQ